MTTEWGIVTGAWSCWPGSYSKCVFAEYSPLFCFEIRVLEVFIQSRQFSLQHPHFLGCQALAVLQFFKHLAGLFLDLLYLLLPILLHMRVFSLRKGASLLKYCPAQALP